MDSSLARLQTMCSFGTGSIIICNIFCKITCSAVALSRILRTALIPYGDMETSTPHSSETSKVITMKVCKFDNVRKTNTCAKFGCNSPARGHTWNIHFLWLFFLPSFLSSCLPACLPAFFLRICTGQTDTDIATHNGSKDAVWRKEVPSQQVFFSHLTFWGSNCPKTPNMLPTVGKSQPNTKHRRTS